MLPVAMRVAAARADMVAEYPVPMMESGTRMTSTRIRPVSYWVFRLSCVSLLWPIAEAWSMLRCPSGDSALTCDIFWPQVIVLWLGFASYACSVSLLWVVALEQGYTVSSAAIDQYLSQLDQKLEGIASAGWEILVSDLQTLGEHLDFIWSPWQLGSPFFLGALGGFIGALESMLAAASCGTDIDVFAFRCSMCMFLFCVTLVSSTLFVACQVTARCIDEHTSARSILSEINRLPFRRSDASCRPFIDMMSDQEKQSYKMFADHATRFVEKSALGVKFLGVHLTNKVVLTASMSIAVVLPSLHIGVIKLLEQVKKQ